MILLRPLKDAYDEILGIKVTNKAVKCLGIYIGHDKEEFDTSFQFYTEFSNIEFQFKTSRI